MADHDTRGGPRLREHRLGRMLTQHEVAEHLEQLAWLLQRRRVGVNPDMVSKWERGAKRPSRFYLKLLCSLFEATPRELGLDVTPPRLLLSGHEDATRKERHLRTLFELLDEMHAPVELLQGKLISLWREELLSRRQMLKAIGIAPAAAGLDVLDGPLAWIPAQSPPRFLGAETVAQLADLASGLESIYHATDPQRLMMPVRALVETAESYLDAAGPGDLGRELLGIVARGQLLAGRASFFDLHRPMEARAHLDVAREAAQEAEDPLLASVALGHMAFLPAEKHQFGAATAYLEGARSQLAIEASASLSSWLFAVDAELSTNAGRIDKAMSCLERARGHLAEETAQAVPVWFDFFDERRLGGFEGFTLRKAGDAHAARSLLEKAIAPDPRTGPKQRAVSMIDLGVVCVEQGDLDEGCRLATDAALTLSRAGYATALDRLTEFQTVLPDPRHPAASLLQEAIADLS